MVKLFVGNLSECVDSHRLKNLFLQYNVKVQECDVLKNFAFVHVATEEDATTAIEELDNSLLEGREIHIERSTSRLRKEPGMGDCCYTCGAIDHKTPSCPQEQGRRKPSKRAGGEIDSGTAAKRPIITSLGSTPKTGSCWGYKVPNIIEDDPELLCPINPEFKVLYDQYKDARARYHYFRDKLQKELNLQAANNASNGTNGTVRIDITRSIQPIKHIVPAPSTPVATHAQPCPSYSSPIYRPQNYPGASIQTPTTASYPGASTTSVYTTSSTVHGHKSNQNSNIYDVDLKPYASTPIYHRPKTYSPYK